MKLVYTPEGTDPDKAQKWPWEPAKLLVPEVIVIERETGLTYEEWVDQMQRNSATAVRAFLWVMLRREQPQLRIGQVIFTMSEISIEADDDETRLMIAQLEERLRDEPLTEQQHANVEGTIAALRADLPATDDDQVDESDDGKSADSSAVVRGEVEGRKAATGPKAGSRSRSA